MNQTRRTTRPFDGSAPRGNVNQASRIEHLRMLATQRRMSEASRQAGQEMSAKLLLSDRVRTVDAEREQAFLDALVNDPVIADASLQWNKGEFGDRTASAREEALKRIIAHHARIYGNETPTMQFGTLPERTAGTYDPSTNTMTIDPMFQHYLLPLKTFNTAAHEARHAYQYGLIDALNSGQMPISDPRYPLAEVFRLNSEFYMPSKPDAAAYERQPMEGHARVLERYKEKPEDRGYTERLYEALRAMWRKQYP